MLLYSELISDFSQFYVTFFRIYLHLFSILYYFLQNLFLSVLDSMLLYSEFISDFSQFYVTFFRIYF
jgi:hypothetical protein